MNRAFLIPLACAMLCACQPRAVPGATQNGLLSVNVIADAGGVIQAEVVNGLTVTVTRAGIVCEKGGAKYDVAVQEPLKSGFKLPLKTKLRPGDAKPAEAASPATCGFLSAELSDGGQWYTPDGNPESTLPTPMFHQ